jgi:hypothetical protein
MRRRGRIDGMRSGITCLWASNWRVARRGSSSCVGKAEQVWSRAGGSAVRERFPVKPSFFVFVYEAALNAEGMFDQAQCLGESHLSSELTSRIARLSSLSTILVQFET